ncbi:AI-2E family transporter [Larkinella sp. C7]|uniref:AI-2E family transporter n=1 Tax=Larkinella sp. C7 TaxID=2576607 RepID=UPI0011111715|nr:AI-2E family transporter [Larkinella sp. C7]
MTPKETLPVSNSVFVRRVGIVLGLTIFALLLLSLLGAAFDVLLLILAATLVALPLRAGARWVSNRTRWPEGVSLAIVGVVLVGGLVGLGLLLSPLVAKQAEQLQQEMPKVLDNARKQLEKTSLGSRLLDQVPQSPEKLFEENGTSRKLARQAFGAVSTTLNTFADIYVLFFLSLFLASQPGLYVDGIVMLVPKSGRQRARHVLDKLSESLLGWLKGTFLSMLIVGILSGLGLWLLGVRLAGILALFAGLITFIPNLGPILALIPALLFALLDGPQQALYVFLLYSGIQAVESNVITPVIQKRLNDIPPALLLVIQIVVGAFAGTMGLAMAAPLLVIGMVLVKMLYVQDVLEDDSVKI